MQVVQECRVRDTVDALRRPEGAVILVQEVPPPDQTKPVGKVELAPVPVSGAPGVTQAEADPLFSGLHDEIHLTQPSFLP
ncbi:MAG TPA: hypothetical protein VFH83_10525, partial [Spirochaetia bacterium]|nr:hypothetical protein [Spirochaetia bacterium]